MDQQGRGADVLPIKDPADPRPAAPESPPPAAAKPLAAATPSPLSPSGFSNHAIHLLRTSQTMHLSLSQMADQKASILMGATFLVFTIAVGQSRNGEIPMALAVLALFAFASALCAVFAVLPKISTPKHGVGSANKLFFGYFTAMEEPEWTEEVLDQLHSDEAMFRMMLHDIYQNGMILHRKKFKYLGLAYRVFIVGLCATVLTFLVEMIAESL